MSAWERARNIPWDKIPSDGSNLDEQKERIFRELQRETIEDELRLQDKRLQIQQQDDQHGDGMAAVTKDSTTKQGSAKPFFQTAIPYSNMELLRQAAFGGTIGSITGAVFGFMDGMRTAASDTNTVLTKASNSAKARFIFQGTSRSAFLFGAFFGGFHVLKYSTRVLMDPGEVPEILVAGAVSMGALAYKPAYRPSMPYAGMLILMDGIQFFMRQY